MTKMIRSGEESRGEDIKDLISFRETYVLDVLGMAVKPSRVNDIEGQHDEDSPCK